MPPLPSHQLAALLLAEVLLQQKSLLLGTLRSPRARPLRKFRAANSKDSPRRTTPQKDVAVIGPVEVKLWARTTARDTDFTGKLVDVHLDGVSHNVLDRIVRARFRGGSKLPPSLIEPGEAYHYTNPLGNAGPPSGEGIASGWRSPPRASPTTIAT